MAILVLAFGAQLLADLVSSGVHEMLTLGTRPRVHLRALAEIWAVDVALGSVGMLAAGRAGRSRGPRSPRCRSSAPARCLPSTACAQRRRRRTRGAGAGRRSVDAARRRAGCWSATRVPP